MLNRNTFTLLLLIHSLRSSHDSAVEESSPGVIIRVVFTYLLIHVIGAAILAFLIIRRRLRKKSKRCQRRIQDRRTGRAPPRFEKYYGIVFVNFDCITQIYFDFSQ